MPGRRARHEQARANRRGCCWFVRIVIGRAPPTLRASRATPTDLGDYLW